MLSCFQGAEAIARLQEVLGEGRLEQHVWLKNKMLGVISCVGNMLQDKSGKKTAEQKRMILRGLGAFISRVGPAIRHIAPQVSGQLLPRIFSLNGS